MNGKNKRVYFNCNEICTICALLIGEAKSCREIISDPFATDSEVQLARRQFNDYVRLYRRIHGLESSGQYVMGVVPNSWRV